MTFVTSDAPETTSKRASAGRIRPYRPGDADAVVDVWHAAGLAEYTYLPTWQALTRPQAGRLFAELTVPRCEIWVGEWGTDICAYLAMEDDYIDRLYVHPDHQGQGWGRRLLDFARDLHPAGLRLHTHVANTRARALYERYGFVAVKFGTSPPPENAPDVEYHWLP